MRADCGIDYIHWKGWDSSRFGVYSKEEEINFGAEIGRAGVVLKESARVLEVGFGNGAFAGWIKQFTGNYVGIESNPVLVSRANDMGIAAYLSGVDLSSISNGGFDLIVAFDVMEHMPKEEVISTLRTWRDNLSEDGRIIIRVPSGDSPFSGRIMYGDITHKTLLATTALQQIAALTNLNLVATLPPAMPIMGLGIKKAAERTIVLLARKFISVLINSTFHGNRHGVITSNLVAIFKL